MTTAVKSSPKSDRKYPVPAKPVARKPPVDEKPPVKASDGAQPDDGQVLDLTALTPTRRLVKLPTNLHPEGENFEMRQLEDFGIEMQQRLLAWSKRYQKLMNSEEELEEDDSALLKHTLDQLFLAVLDAPDSATRSMPDNVRNRVVTAFLAGPLLARHETQMEVLRRLVERKALKQEQVDEVLQEIRLEVSQLTMES